MIAHGYLAAAAFGTATVADGLLCTQTLVPSMSVTVGPGLIATNLTIDSTSFGSLPARTTEPLVKLGINTLPTTMGPFTAPASAGQSQAFLIQAQFTETDASPVVLPYYNASNPQVPFSGPGNTGTAQNTQRIQRVLLQSKAGTPATTGSQVTPTADAGFVGLYQITIANGATTIVNANIVQLQTAPFVDPLRSGRGVRPGRLLATRIFSTPGTSVYTPSAGTAEVVVELVGGGGAGGGATITGAGQCSGGAGGGGGGISRKRITSAFSGVTLTIGAGGVPAAGAAGGNGGSTSFGALVSATGGNGGSLGPAFANTTLNLVGQGTGGMGTGGDVNGLGFGGGPAFYAVNPVSGTGGGSPYGAGGPYVSSTSAGTTAVSPGAGGSGGCLQASSAVAASGGSGAPGLIIVREYA